MAMPQQPIKYQINRQLLRSVSLLAVDEPTKALQHAEDALFTAVIADVFYLQSKSHLYRGMCLMKLGRWIEASWAFTRAASVCYWGGKAGELKMECEKMARIDNLKVISQFGSSLKVEAVAVAVEEVEKVE
ncbi:hypothetical protein BJ878DRAFT_483057 [Calycina marina]|uniref:Uncharacterized protein n=1 Tax=Calycina marina TaxID=1763456 RepID=A0A9P7YWW0_9HELO|nr:hypothetical protein BJ878DRAFT_483057 [Calycina marina]